VNVYWFLVGYGCVVIRVASQHGGETFTRQLASATKCTYLAVVVIDMGLSIPAMNYTALRFRCLIQYITVGLSLKQLATRLVDAALTLHVCIPLPSLDRILVISVLLLLMMTMILKNLTLKVHALNSVFAQVCTYI